MTTVADARPAPGSATPDAAGVYAPGRPVDLRLTLFPLRRGHADPTLQWTADGAAWRTQRTPEGPALLQSLLPPVIWDPAMVTVLGWPAGIAMGGLGAILLILFRKRPPRRRQRFGALA